MADIPNITYSPTEPIQDYYDKLIVAIDTINDHKRDIETLTVGQVARQASATPFDFEGVLVPTLVSGTRTKDRLNIGTWNMDTTDSLNVAHGLSATEWKTMTIISVDIRNDNDDTYYNIERVGGAGAATTMGGSVSSRNSTNIVLVRVENGIFDDAAFNNTSGSYNRGFINIEYTPD